MEGNPGGRHDSPQRIGRYVVVDRVGQGGMGVVYRAWDPELRRTVALKTLAGLAGLPQRDRLTERFLREARAIASLTHPNIVTIFDIGHDQGLPFIAMEFVEGESMAQLIGRGAPLTLATKVSLTLGLCRGLAYAHSYGVIHRDIKPANLMVTVDGVLKILDFGLARVMGDLTHVNLTQTGALLGTIGYMAPEQLTGQPADERSDIFAVGAVLYEWFSYRRAFEGNNPSTVLFDIVQTPPFPLKRLVPELPDSLVRIVGKALEKEPAKRYQSLEEVSGDLEKVLVPSSPEVAPIGVNAVDPPSSGVDGLLQHWGAEVARALASQPDAAPAGAPRTDVRGSRKVPEPIPVTPPHPGAGAADASGVIRAASHRNRLVQALAVMVAMVAVAGYVTLSRSPAPASQSLPPQDPPAVAPQEGAVQRTAPLTQPSSPTPSSTPRGPTSSANVRRGAGASGASEISSPRCKDLLERVSIGDELLEADRQFLAAQCGQGGR